MTIKRQGLGVLVGCLGVLGWAPSRAEGPAHSGWWSEDVILEGEVQVGEPPPTVWPTTIDLATAQVVDLTHTFDDTTLYWPTSPSAFELKTLAKGPAPGGYHYEANLFCTPEHGGTHLDAPVHFAEGAQSADHIPLKRLMGSAAVIDIRVATSRRANYRLTRLDVKRWEAKFGAIPAGAVVLLNTGWGPRWPDRKAYLGDDTPGDASKLQFPSFGPEAVEYLVNTRKIAAIGVDTASIDPGDSKDFPVHRLVGAANVPALENVAHLDALPPVGAIVMALPMKIGGGSGGPARIVAFLPPKP
ncbi:MAG: cyclase family protein [Myxococcales bacterium]|nr:cyclase family protein [Myxococcales bacterium]